MRWAKFEVLLQFKLHALSETLNLSTHTVPQAIARISGKHVACHSVLPLVSLGSHPRPLCHHHLVYANTLQNIKASNSHYLPGFVHPWWTAMFGIFVRFFGALGISKVSCTPLSLNLIAISRFYFRDKNLNIKSD